MLCVCIQNDMTPVKKYCPHHLVDSDLKANVTCAVFNWNGTGQYSVYHLKAAGWGPGWGLVWE